MEENQTSTPLHPCGAELVRALPGRLPCREDMPAVGNFKVRSGTRRQLVHAVRFTWLLLLVMWAIAPEPCTAGTQITAWGMFLGGQAPAAASNVVALAAGDDHALALRADGTVIGWGAKNYGQATVPPDITNAVRIAAGSTHSLALLEDGTVRFWGNIYSTGVTNPPASAITNMVGLGVGASAQHALGVRTDGAAAEWGNSSYGLPSVPTAATNVIAAALGSYHSLVLRADGRVVNWGRWLDGGVFSPPPASATNVVAVAAGFSHDLVLRADGRLVSWGVFGSDATIPAGATNVIAIASGGNQRMALRADRQVFTWQSGGATNALPAGLSNVVGIAASTSGYLAISADDGPPVVGRMLQPTVAAGTDTRLSVLAVSTTPLAYQWVLNGTNVPGGTNVTLVLANVQPDQAGDYTVIVSNAFGAVTNTTQMTVEPLLIQVPPQSQMVLGGSNVTFSVAALGQKPFTYQWQCFDTNVLNATNSSLVLTNVLLSQAGSYSVIVSNAYGAVTSPSAMLEVIPLRITSPPQNQTSFLRGTATFNVAASGKSPFGYQWRLDGTNIPSATNAELVLTNVQLSDAGTYSVVVSNAYGGVESGGAALTVVPILITAHPANQSAFLGQTLSLTVSAGANPPLNYQWQLNGTNIPGATSPGLWLTNCQYSHSGAYRVLLDNGLDTTNSLEAILAVAQVASWGSAGQSTVPAGLSGLTRLAAGAGHTTALTGTGTVVSWGNSYTNVPVLATNMVAVAAGGDKSWGLREDGGVVGWKGATPTLSTIPPEITTVLAVDAGVSHDLALLPDHTVATWGANSQGQTSLPGGLTNVVTFAAGSSHSLALKADGTVVAWGYNGTGQTNVPAGLTNVVAIAAGVAQSMALTADGRVSVWGQTFSTIPASATNVVAIAAGYGHCLGLKADGTVVAWGYHYNGETNVPAGLKNVVGIAARDLSSQALVADGTPLPALSLTNPRWGTEGFAVTVASRSGRVYQLEFNDSLASDLWKPLPLVAGRGGPLDLTDPTAVGSHRFYRVREW